MTRVPVLVCGEPERGDDALAFAAVRALPDRAARLADVRYCGQLEVEALLELPLGTPCVIVDAAVGVRPGTVVTLPLERVAGRAAGGGPRSSHALPVEQVLALAAVLRGEPPSGTFVGMGGSSFGLGDPLSPAVAAALPELTARIAAEIAHLAGEPYPAGRPAPRRGRADRVRKKEV